MIHNWDMEHNDLFLHCISNKKPVKETKDKNSKEYKRIRKVADREAIERQNNLPKIMKMVRRLGLNCYYDRWNGNCDFFNFILENKGREVSVWLTPTNKNYVKHSKELRSMILNNPDLLKGTVILKK